MFFYIKTKVICFCQFQKNENNCKRNKMNDIFNSAAFEFLNNNNMIYINLKYLNIIEKVFFICIIIYLSHLCKNS